MVVKRRWEMGPRRTRIVRTVIGRICRAVVSIAGVVVAVISTPRAVIIAPVVIRAVVVLVAVVAVIPVVSAGAIIVMIVIARTIGIVIAVMSVIDLRRRRRAVIVARAIGRSDSRGITGIGVGIIGPTASIDRGSENH